MIRALEEKNGITAVFQLVEASSLEHPFRTSRGQIRKIGTKLLAESVVTGQGVIILNQNRVKG